MYAIVYKTKHNAKSKEWHGMIYLGRDGRFVAHYHKRNENPKVRSQKILQQVETGKGLWVSFVPKEKMYSTYRLFKSRRAALKFVGDLPKSAARVRFYKEITLEEYENAY